MIIYLITNAFNGKQYVGQTVKSLQCRWKTHVYRAIHSILHLPLHRAIRKYGAQNFIVRELYVTRNEKDLNRMEVHYIKKFNTVTPNGYNISPGGHKKFTAYQRQQVSIGLRKSVKVKAARQRMSAEGHPMHKLTWKAVRSIRSTMMNPQIQTRDVARKFGVTTANILYIVKGQTWYDRAWQPKGHEMEMVTEERRRLARMAFRPNAKLTMKQAKEIRQIYLGGQYTTREIAQKFSVDRTTVNCILHNQIWKDPDWDATGLATVISVNRKRRKPARLKLTQDIACRIRELRYDQRLSVASVAVKVGLSMSVLKQFLSGKHPYYPNETSETRFALVDARCAKSVHKFSAA